MTETELVFFVEDNADLYRVGNYNFKFLVKAAGDRTFHEVDVDLEIPPCFVQDVATPDAISDFELSLTQA